MSWRGRHILCLPFMRRAYATSNAGHIKTGLTQSILNDINTSSSRPERIDAALQNNLFALATLISLGNPRLDLSLGTQQRIVRGLTQYHPRLTPINLNALIQLHKTMSCEISSIDKAMLVKSLIAFGDQQLLRSGFDLISKAEGGPIPSSAIMHLVFFAKQRHSIESCVLLWEYMKEYYPLTLSDYSSLMLDLMETFARSRTFAKYAERVSRACIGNASNPSIALGIAKASYLTGDKELMKDLKCAPGFQPTREIEGLEALLNAKLGGAKPDFELSAQENASMVRILAESDVQAAEQFGPEIEPTVEHAMLKQIALCNQYIKEGNLTKYNDSMRMMRSNNALEGIQLNLKLKWELLHGSFRFAKRHYQNFVNVPHKQRVIALNTLSTLALDEESKEWVAGERRRLEAVPLMA